MKHLIVILLLCFMIASFSQEQSNKVSNIILYSSEKGYNWNADQEEESVKQFLSNIFKSYFVNQQRPLRVLTSAEKEKYSTLIDYYIRKLPQNTKTTSAQSVDLTAQLTYSSLFYKLIVTIEFPEPIFEIRLNPPEGIPFFIDDENNIGNIISRQTIQNTTETGLKIAWKYTVEWNDLLLEEDTTEIPLLVSFTKKASETHIISFKKEPDPYIQYFLHLSPKNFTPSSVLLRTDSENNKPGSISGVQLRGGNDDLYSIIVHCTWKDIQARRSWTISNFLCSYYNSQPPSNLNYQITPLWKPTSGKVTHFLGFEAHITHYEDFVAERGTNGILSFQDNVIVLDYIAPENVDEMVWVDLPNIKLSQHCCVWVKYPEDSKNWLEVPADKRNGEYFFNQKFLPSGNTYHYAIQRKDTRRVYRSVPIGITAKQKEEHLSKEAEKWGVPWRGQDFDWQ